MCRCVSRQTRSADVTRAGALAAPQRAPWTGRDGADRFAYQAGRPLAAQWAAEEEQRQRERGGTGVGAEKRKRGEVGGRESVWVRGKEMAGVQRKAEGATGQTRQVAGPGASSP